MKQHHRIMVGSILTLVLVPSMAFADMGVPMLFVTFPAMCAALIPIIFLEAWVMAKRTEVGFKKSLETSGVANVASTILGIPLTWALLVVIQMLTLGGRGYGGIDTILGKFIAVTWQAPWLIPYEDNLYWMIPTASLVLLVPFFFASWLVEYWVARWMNKSIEPRIMKKVEFKMNLYSYLMLAGFNLIWLVLSLFQKTTIGL